MPGAGVMSVVSRESVGRRTVELEGVSCGLQTGRRGAVDPGTGGRAARGGRETAGDEKEKKRNSKR